MMYLDKLWVLWENTFFTEVLLQITLWTAFVLGLKKRVKSKTEIYFLFYTILTLLLFLLVQSYWIIVQPELGKKRFLEIINIAYAVGELLILSQLFYIILINRVIKRLVKFLVFSFIIISTIVVVWMEIKNMDGLTAFSTGDVIISSGLAILAIPCIAFFFENISSDLKSSHKDKMMFVISLFTYIVIIIPAFVIFEIIFKENHLLYRLVLSLHYLSISNIFFQIIRYYRRNDQGLSTKEKTSKRLYNFKHEHSAAVIPK